MTGFTVSLIILSILSLSYLITFWTHQAYGRFVLTLFVASTYYWNLFNIYLSYSWQYITKNTDCLVSTIVYILVFFFGGWWLSKNLDRPNKDEVLSGTELINAAKANKINQKQNKAWGLEYPIKIGAVEIAFSAENQHFAICGTTGSGKTQAINQMLLTIRARNKKAIIADAGGEFISHFYRAEDKILNPFDQRSASWSPFAEIRQDYDCSMIAKLTIPESEKIIA